ncbi:MAG: hypothetical protein U9M90_04310 [Patescibacteria group bacterium]|nr:hypothetical protein [Patescibacteria group bacterium]
MPIDLLISLGIPKQYAGDILVALLYILTSIGVTIFIKKRDLGALLFSLYIAYAIVTKTFFKFAQNPTTKAVILIVSIFLLFALIKHYVRMKISGGKIIVWVKTLLIALSIVGLLASIVLQWLPALMLKEFFTAFSSEVFLSKEAQLIWMIVPLVLIFMLKHKQRVY